MGVAIVTLVAFSLYTMDYFWGVKVQASNDILSISIGNKKTIVPSQQQVYKEPKVIQTSANNYEFDLSGEKVQLGSSTKDFTPTLKFWRFGNESSVELSLIGGGRVASFTSSSVSNGIITADNQYFTLSYFAVPQKEGFNELGGIDMKMVLKRNPGLNVVTFTYNHMNADAFLQPALTVEYTAGWSDEFNCNIAVNETAVTNVATGEILAERPVHVVNSIAFYGDPEQVNNGYKTGKIGHLYRMRVTDSATIPKTTWADWGFGGGQSQITLTVPQAFLDAATYPFKIEPVGDTFGYTSAGASGGRLLNDRITGGVYAGATGTGTSISAWISAGYDSCLAKCALYDTASTANLITNSVTEELTINTTSGYELKTFNFISAPTLSAQDYRIVGWGDASGVLYSIAYDTVDGASADYATATYGASFPATQTFSSLANRKVSIYCTYTPSASLAITNDPSSKAFGIIATSSTYYADGSAPSNPVGDGDCNFTLTNSGSTCDIDAKIADFTGGVGWNIAASNPGQNEVQITIYASGTDPASGLVLSNTDQEWIDALAAGTKKWDLKMVTGSSFTDGSEKSSTLTLTATTED